jgi:hypothetical protein
VVVRCVFGAGAAAAAQPAPFGHSCHAQNGVRFCPTSTSAQRVRSFDGVPLDVDVTLPAHGSGPFRTIVMLHGWGGGKTDFESHDPAGNGSTTYHYNNTYYARHGYFGSRLGQLVRRRPSRRSLRPLRQGLHPPGGTPAMRRVTPNT